MISHKILTRKDVGDLSKYYEDGVDDYYSKELDASQWQGKGAERLKLEGEINQRDFTQLLTGEVIGDEVRSSSTRLDSNKRLGIDLTFSAPKSVSLQALVHGDIEIIKAHDRAVSKVIEAIETQTEARRKERGKSYVETTGNLIVAKFRHETNRETDPQLHTHAVILNLTQRADGAWRNLKNDNIIQNSKYFGSLYRSELAAECQKLGYGIRLEANGLFELAHINRDQINAFSQRSAQVETYLAKRGLDRESATTGQKQTATLNTRKTKGEVDRDALHQHWREKSQELGIQFDKKAPPSSGAAKQLSEGATAKSLDFAIKHLSERQAVFTHMELMNAMLQHGVGAVTKSSVEQEIINRLKSGELYRGEQRYITAQNKERVSQTKEQWIAYSIDKGMNADTAKSYISEAIVSGRLVPDAVQLTTQTALKLEREILSFEKTGRQSVAPVTHQSRLDHALSKSDLNEGQRKAVETIALSHNAIIGVQGLAGTGKSHMLQFAKTILEQGGYEVKALAPYGSQVKALKELNMEANTLASFLARQDKEINAKTVLIVDEAGVVPARQMHALLETAKANGSRVVLLGDIAQTKAIEAGRPFDQLQRNGMTTVVMDQIQRQKNPELKLAVELASKGETKQSLSKISRITEIEKDDERRFTIAENYTNLSPREREQTIIVSGTNDARKEINANIRQLLKLDGKGIEIETLDRRDSTKAERMYVKNYHYGDIIKFEQDYLRLNLNKGDLYMVVNKNHESQLMIRSLSNQNIITIDPMKQDKISVYEPVRKEFSVGDDVRITRNMPDYGVTNGDRFRVSKTENGEIEIANRFKTLTMKTSEPLHLDYSYATTVHSSQGLTADRVMYDAKTTSKTTSKDVFYVAISRARHTAEIYTDSTKRLPAAVAQLSGKTAAMDLEGKNAGIENSKSHAKDHGIEMEK